MSISLDSLGAAARRVLAEGAPLPARVMAARGAVPGARPDELVTVVVLLTEAPEPEVRSAAEATITKLPAPLLTGALAQQLERPVVAALARRYGTDVVVLPRLLAQRSLDETLLVDLCRSASEAAGEVIATNEALILRYPAAIEALYMNRQVRMSTADRLIHLAVRSGLELGFAAFKQAAAAIQDQLVAEPTEEPIFDDVLFKNIDETAKLIDLGEEEDVAEETETGEAEVSQKALPLFAFLQQATVTQKIRMAMLGEAAARLILVRDKNRLVAEAAARSPRLTENEGAQIAAMRSVSEEVLRQIAMNRELVRSYKVKLNLVNNPRTPLTFASGFLSHLRQNDLKLLARSKNVPAAVSKMAREAMLRRR